MKPGYSFQTVSENIAALERGGWPRVTAIAHAMSHARADFFKRHPGGALENWLAFPKGRRLRQHYNADGTPLDSRQSSRASYADNPVRRLPRETERRAKRAATVNASAEVQRAARLYTEFSGHTDLKAIKIKAPVMPKALLAIGHCDGVLYSTVRDGRAEKYIHRFAKDSRPLLTASPDGKQLYMLGGAYDFTERGIVDKKPRR